MNFVVVEHLSALEVVKNISELKKPQMFIHFINIPSGEAIYIEFPDAGEMLIYGGDKKRTERVGDYLSDLFKEKEGHFVSALKSFVRWLPAINTVILRYPDEEVIEGVVEILDRAEVENLYGPIEQSGSISPPFTNVPGSLLAFHLYFNPSPASGQSPEMKKKQLITKYKELKYKSKIKTPEQIESDVEIEIVNPSKPIKYYEYNKNYEDSEWIKNNEVIFKLRFDEITFLFLGNINKNINSKLENKPSSILEAGIVEISSSSLEFPSVLEKINPKIIIFEGKDRRVEKMYSGRFELYSLCGKLKLILVTDGKKVFLKK